MPDSRWMTNVNFPGSKNSEISALTLSWRFTLLIWPALLFFLLWNHLGPLTCYLLTLQFCQCSTSDEEHLQEIHRATGQKTPPSSSHFCHWLSPQNKWKKSASPFNQILIEISFSFLKLSRNEYLQLQMRKKRRVTALQARKMTWSFTNTHKLVILPR